MNLLSDSEEVEDSHFYTKLVKNSITYTIQRAEELTARDIADTGMNRCGVLRYDFMPKIADISFKTTEMKCVTQCLADLYQDCRRPLSKQEIETDLQTIYLIQRSKAYEEYEKRLQICKDMTAETIIEEEILQSKEGFRYWGFSFFQFNKYQDFDIDEIPKDYIFSYTPNMVLEWAKKKDITCYAFDQKHKLFHKRVSKTWNRPPLVYYSVDDHMDMIQNKKTIESIIKKHAITTKSLTSFSEFAREVVDLSDLPIYDYELLNDVVDKLPIYTICDVFEWIQAPSIVMVQSSNLYKIFVELFKSGKVPMTKFKGDDNYKKLFRINVKMV
jgi:hypothetical protein